MSAGHSAPPGVALQPAEIATRSGSNFLSGFVCLDAERRAGMTAIYAFCRVVDDAVDEAPDAGTGFTQLEYWRRELVAAAEGEPRSAVGRALQAAMRRFAVPPAPLFELLDGVATDLRSPRCADEAELRRYCHRVASAVGLACLPVLGATSPGASRYAERLGQALQLTNILRDLRSDAIGGRIYVPQTWLEAAGVEPRWLAGEGPTEAAAARGPLARLCARLAAAARAEFAAARAELRLLARRERRALLPPRIMAAVYQALLTRLERRSGELGQPRVRVPRPQKLWLAALVWTGLRW